MPAVSTGVPWARYLSALYRYKWLIALFTLAGAAVGVFGSSRIVPQYEVYSTIWIATETPQARTAGPIRAERLLNTTSWQELIRSYSILDKVARNRRLYVQAERGTPSALFATFETAQPYRTGEYELRVNAATNRFELLNETGALVERGAIGDSVGRAIGFRWVPDPVILRTLPSARFSVTTPRNAAIGLQRRLTPFLPRESSLLRVQLMGSDPVEITETMTALVDEFVSTAADLKTRNLVEFAKTLDQQLAYAAQEMRNAEIALESFRVRTITLPTEGGSIAAGLEMTRDPVLRHFFDQKLQLDSIRNDRESLERSLESMRRGDLSVQALWSVPAVHGATPLVSALNEYTLKLSTLRAAQQLYTDAHPTVIEHKATIARLESTIIPQLAAELRDNLRRRETDMQSRVDGSSRELRQIPTRTIEEMRLRRTVELRTQLYSTLKGRYEEARLAEVSAMPDVRVFDYPSRPQQPSVNSAPKILFLAVFGSFGIAILVALLLDMFDRRFRYPEQATNELGLDIVGVVPRIRAARSRRARDEQAWQVTEAFRMIRLGVTHAHAGVGPLTLTISSPESGDGKSLIAANLALSFAGAGYRTVLVDGDVRRGLLHTYFRLPSGQPGLTDFLAGQASLDAIIQSADGELSLIPSGTRGRRAPELLASRTMSELVESLRARFDVVIVDSAPLGAGIDAFVLATWTTNLMMVLRAGQTDRKMAEAKLRLLDRLPVRVLGTVLNAVRTTGAYRYYSYTYGYEDEGTPTKGKGSKQPRFTELVKTITRSS